MILSDDFTDNYANATTNFNSSVSINKIGLQQGTDRTVYIEWQWGQENSTKEYKVIWYYRTSNGTTFIGDESTTTHPKATYTAPSNAAAVSVKVQPIANTRKVNGNDCLWWTAQWSKLKNYSFSANPPTKPSAPTVTVSKQKHISNFML